MTRKEIRITTLDPLILEDRPGVSNEHTTLDYIPATRLRGAFFEALPSLAFTETPDPEALFGLTGPRWTCAFPCDPQWNPYFPTPRCRQPGKEHPSRWWRIAAPRIVPEPTPIEINMSLGRHYGRRAHRHSALYARSAISPGTNFVAWVESGLLPNQEAVEINLGTRRSANGRCRVVVLDDDTASHWTCTDRNGGPAVIQLVADAIVPGLHGGYLRGLDGAAFTRFADTPVRVVAGFSSAHIHGGWSGKWKLPRESAITIQSGSVWLVESEHDRDALAFSRFLERVKERGIGIRAHEGFGTAVVNPAWITVTKDPQEPIRVLDSADPPSPNPSDARRWAALPHHPLADHEACLTSARAAAESLTGEVRDKLQGQLDDWIAITARYGTGPLNKYISIPRPGEPREKQNERKELWDKLAQNPELRPTVCDQLQNQPGDPAYLLMFLRALQFEIESLPKETKPS